MRLYPAYLAAVEQLWHFIDGWSAAVTRRFGKLIPRLPGPDRSVLPTAAARVDAAQDIPELTAPVNDFAGVIDALVEASSSTR